jgi:hypothetical protein
VLALLDLAGTDVAFLVVASIAVVAFMVMVVITLQWAFRIDRVGRREWLERRRSAARSADLKGPRSNGRPPGPADGRDQP